QKNRINVQLLVDRRHDAEHNELLDHFGSVLMQKLGCFANSHVAANNNFLRCVVNFLARRLRSTFTTSAAFTAAVILEIPRSVIVKTSFTWSVIIIPFAGIILARIVLAWRRSLIEVLLGRCMSCDLSRPRAA